MSPLYEHENFGDVQRYVFMKGIITDVDSEYDTADVTIPGGSDGSGVPIFYHCSDEAEERSNGAIEGGSAAFSAGTDDDPEDGDEVIVMYDVEDNEAVRIIGFVDGIKGCGYHEPFNSEGCVDNFWGFMLEDYTYFGPFTLTIDCDNNAECNSPAWDRETYYCSTELPYHQSGGRGYQELTFIDVPDSTDKTLRYYAEYPPGIGATSVCDYILQFSPQYTANLDYKRFVARGLFNTRISEEPYLRIQTNPIIHPMEEDEPEVPYNPSVEQPGWGYGYRNYSFKTIKITVPLVNKDYTKFDYSSAGHIKFYYIRSDESLATFEACIWSAWGRAAEGDENPAYSYDLYGNPILWAGGTENVFNLYEWDDQLEEDDFVNVNAEYGIEIQSYAIPKLLGTLSRYPNSSGTWSDFSVEFQVSDIKLV